MGGKPRAKPKPYDALAELGELLDEANAVVTLHGVPLNKKRTPLEDAYRELGKAIKKLNPEHKRVGRSNSRAVVLRRLKRVREILDKEFPTIAKKRKKHRGERSDRQKIRDFQNLMAKRRYTQMGYDELHGFGIADGAGVKMYRCPVSATPYWPLWLDIMAKDPGSSRAAMRKMAKNKPGQLQLEAAWRLGEADDGPDIF